MRSIPGEDEARSVTAKANYGQEKYMEILISILSGGAVVAVIDHG